jgi:hypothetical protein
LAQTRVCLCTNGHMQAQRKKHHMEHKLPDIFKALRLSWV